MSEAIICEGCGIYRNNKFCSYFGVEIRAVACDAFKAKEPAKPKFRDIPIVNRGEFVAGNLDLSNWMSETNFVGFRATDGAIIPCPVYVENGKVNRATHVVVEE